MRRLSEFLKRIFGLHLCARCAHFKFVHERSPMLLDETSCLSCKIGESVHPFEELEGRTRK